MSTFGEHINSPISGKKVSLLADPFRGLGGGVRGRGEYPSKGVKKSSPSGVDRLHPPARVSPYLGNLRFGPLGFLGRGRIGKRNRRLA